MTSEDDKHVHHIRSSLSCPSNRPLPGLAPAWSAMKKVPFSAMGTSVAIFVAGVTSFTSPFLYMARVKLLALNVAVQWTQRLISLSRDTLVTALSCPKPNSIVSPAVNPK